MKQTLASLLVAFALVAGGCSTSADDTSSTLPTAPSTPLVTDNFSGTVQVGSNDLHPFTVTSGGFPITIDLTTAGPPATIAMGLGVGSAGWNELLNVTGGTYHAPAARRRSSRERSQRAITAWSSTTSAIRSAPITYTAVVLHY